MPSAAGLTEAGVAWLILLAAVLTAAAGIALRAFVGRRADRHVVGRLTRRMRQTALARKLFGRIQHDALDPDELDQTILLPTLVLASALCLTGLFLLGYRTLT